MKTLKTWKTAVFCIAAATFLLSAQNAVTAEAVTPEVCKVSVVNSQTELDNISAGYSKSVNVDSDVMDNAYISFTLNQDSWVRITGSYSMNENDYGQTHVNIYTDSAFSNKKGEYGWGYWEYDNEYMGFLKKGTYYAHINTQLGNGTYFKGNVNVLVGAIPTSKIFTPEISVKKGQMTVRLKNVLGSYAKGVQYQPGKIALTNCKNSKYWKWKLSGNWYDGSDTCVLMEDQGGYFQFKTRKSGYYTILVEDTADNRYSKVIKVTVPDKEKPVVKGVKNKKTYKKAVKITFSDKGSGIKSAKLNGKNIKSGKKVTKKGSYTLIVTDKAGNTTKIRFKIKK